jgi:4'-phosphopantetheinyl transferase
MRRGTSAGGQAATVPGPAGEVLLRLVRTDRLPGLPLPAHLGPGERRRARALARPQDRTRYVAAHSALRRLLAARLGVAPGQVVLTLSRARCAAARTADG